MSDESHHERELGGQLLASVSRSFYLTLKALPRQLREPLSLAYLLARTADTIADTAAVPAVIRLDALRQYRAIIGGRDAADRNALASLLARDFIHRQSDEAERRLMERFHDGLAWLDVIPDGPAQSIRHVLNPIIDGQILDVERFPSDGRVRSLRTAAELDDYTWLVAGCVGEFWTEMCASELPEALDATVPLEQMKAWGVRLGKGLQLINILRDIREDLDDGRCYLPEEQWAPLGLSMAELPSQTERLRPVWLAWLETASAHLDAGLHYVQHVADGKLRYATALPLLIGAKTIAHLQRASWPEIERGVKVSRLEMGMILAEAAVACRHPDRVARLFRKLQGRP